MLKENKDIRNNKPERVSRRGFLRILWIALVSISLLEVASVIVAFLTSGGRKSSSHQLKGLKVLARLDDIPMGSVTAFRSDKLYLVRMDDGGLLALSLQCTHLGCAITWNKKNREFDCPCHASSFSMGGDVISPPAPRALDTYHLVIEGGQIKVDLNKVVKRKAFSQAQLTYA